MKKVRKNKPLLAIVLLFVLMFLYACNNDDYVPKPRGYFRIALPEKKYKLFDTVYPYSFEYPEYSVIKPDIDKRAEPYWINLEFPSFKGTLHISYKKVSSDSILYQYFEDARTFANKHIAKAEDIEPKIIRDDKHKMYGMIYDISGSGVASTYPFCVTDSTTHFLRGALYFNVMPNNDSLSPVIDFIKSDIDHLIQTLRWAKKD